MQTTAYKNTFTDEWGLICESRGKNIPLFLTTSRKRVTSNHRCTHLLASALLTPQGDRESPPPLLSLLPKRFLSTVDLCGKVISVSFLLLFVRGKPAAGRLSVAVAQWPLRGGEWKKRSETMPPFPPSPILPLPRDEWELGGGGRKEGRKGH